MTGDQRTPMTREMIERVAAVLKEHFDNRWGQEAPVTDAEAKLIARAAIEAMREPTDAMVENAWASAMAEDARQTWKDMIDAALPEPPK